MLTAKVLCATKKPPAAAGARPGRVFPDDPAMSDRQQPRTRGCHFAVRCPSASASNTASPGGRARRSRRYISRTPRGYWSDRTCRIPSFKPTKRKRPSRHTSDRQDPSYHVVFSSRHISLHHTLCALDQLAQDARPHSDLTLALAWRRPLAWPWSWSRPRTRAPTQS